MNWVSHYLKSFKIISNNYRWFTASFIAVSTLFILCSALNSLLPVLLRNAANTFDGAPNASTQFLLFAGCYALLWTVSQVLSSVRGVFSAWILAKCDATLYETILTRIFQYAHSKQRTLDPGYVAADINRSASSFSLVTVGVFWTIVPIAVEIIVAISVLYAIMGAAYAMLFLVACVALTSLAIYVAKSSSSIHRALFEADNNLSSYTVERLGRVYDIKINNSLPKELALGRTFFDNYVKTIRDANLRMGIRIACQGLAIGVVLTFFILLSGLYYRTNFTAGDFIMIVGYITLFTLQLHLLAGTLFNLQAHLISLNDGIKYIEEDIKEQYHPKHHADVEGFTLTGVTLAKDNRTILNNINGQLMSGVNIISGKSGAGKTTLINILLGLEESHTGTALYRGHRISEALTEHILSEVSVAPQKPVLVSGTLEDNLLYGAGDVCQNRLKEIVELLGFTRQGTDADALLATVIDVAGSGLSGGEKQRIAIGRAILRDKPTLILDEPTAALDERTAHKIVEWLALHTRNLIIVTHDEKLKKKYGIKIELNETTADSIQV
ncbi:ATP-binding cassette domain-containing protein [Pseudomonas rustica]|uniref:ABC transporter ATP-binding protein n=1 Tax=Pseudomonas rustica TaxID=2827099 RepID=A0ABS5MWD3_9PSED|nr:ABC transporter ATP-binding protein [Pseudomonas rustica]MBS4078276.1 ABC transporter ATP-binding protein [Pseudomonas rustica]